MKNIHEILSVSREYLEKAGVINARYSAEAIIAYVLGCKRLEIYLNFDRPLTSSELDAIRECIKRRKAKEPLEYIFNSTEFYNCKLEITKDVLIPRPETEQLVDLVFNILKNDLVVDEELNLKNPEKAECHLFKKILWDICTGSGSIAISLKKALPSLDVYASDISTQALDIAKSNAKVNGCEIDFRLGDLLEPFKNEKADYLICNPPYISEMEYSLLMDDVKKFEPKKALIAEDNGLYFYKKLADILPSFLNPKAKVFFEIDYRQGDLLKDIFVDGRWLSKKVYKDLSGKDRFFFLEIE